MSGRLVRGAGGVGLRVQAGGVEGVCVGVRGGEKELDF